jgi:hypothetical protein
MKKWTTILVTGVLIYGASVAAFEMLLRTGNVGGLYRAIGGLLEVGFFLYPNAVFSLFVSELSYLGFFVAIPLACLLGLWLDHPKRTDRTIFALGVVAFASVLIAAATWMLLVSGYGL